jgi:hypothetical protein
MVLGRHPTKPAVWVYAVLLTLFVHVGIVLGALLLRPFDPSTAASVEPDVIQVVFAPEPESHSKEPSFFSELPPDRADESPERADLLSNVDSRARDNAPGGTDEGLPSQEGESEAPHVRMETGTPGSPEVVSEETTGAGAEPREPADAQESPKDSEEDPSPADPEGVTLPVDQEGAEEETMADPSLVPGQNEPEVLDPLENLRREKSGSDLPDPSQPGVGSSDILQEAMSNPEGNTQLYGDISLNTIAWDYAPWLQEFRRRVIQRWRAPYGYYLGVINGWTLVELEIARSGELLRMEVLGEDGHESLKNASVGVLKAVKPYRRLPDHFPEESLILQIKLVYPGREK